MSSYDVVIKDLPAQLVAGVRDVIPTYPNDGRLFDELYAYLGRRSTISAACACQAHISRLSRSKPQDPGCR
jgi:hypothetical protein